MESKRDVDRIIDAIERTGMLVASAIIRSGDWQSAATEAASEKFDSADVMSPKAVVQHTDELAKRLTEQLKAEAEFGLDGSEKRGS